MFPNRSRLAVCARQGAHWTTITHLNGSLWPFFVGEGLVCARAGENWRGGKGDYEEGGSARLFEVKGGRD